MASLLMWILDRSQSTEAFLINGLASLVDCAQSLLSAPPPDGRKAAPDAAALEASLMKAHEQQRLRSERTIQNEILRQVRFPTLSYMLKRCVVDHPLSPDSPLAAHPPFECRSQVLQFLRLT